MFDYNNVKDYELLLERANNRTHEENEQFDKLDTKIIRLIHKWDKSDTNIDVDKYVYKRLKIDIDYDLFLERLAICHCGVCAGVV